MRTLLFDFKLIFQFIKSFAFLSGVLILSACVADVEGPTLSDLEQVTLIEFSNTPNILGLDSVFSFGHVPVGATATKRIFVLNSGDRNVSSMEFTLPEGPFAFSGGLFPGTGGDCLAELNAGSFCTIEINYTANAMTTSSGMVTLDILDERGTSDSFTFDTDGTGDTPPSLAITRQGRLIMAMSP